MSYIVNRHLMKRNQLKIFVISKRYLQSFPDSLLKYSREINKKSIVKKPNLNDLSITIDLTVDQFLYSKEEYTEKKTDSCGYCGGLGVITCLECRGPETELICDKCNGWEFIKCYICNGSGISHRTF
jgi:DnaJ-class molecular chaperone